jgi:hypothetical protein
MLIVTIKKYKLLDAKPNNGSKKKVKIIKETLVKKFPNLKFGSSIFTRNGQVAKLNVNKIIRKFNFKGINSPIRKKLIISKENMHVEIKKTDPKKIVFFNSRFDIFSELIMIYFIVYYC